MAKKKTVAKMEAPCAAPSKSSNGLAHNAEESCVMENHPPFNIEWSTVPADEDSDMGFGPGTLMPGLPDAALVALDDLAKNPN